MKDTIVVISGYSGSGKSTVSTYLNLRNIPIVSMGKVVCNSLARNGLPIIEENERKHREWLRKRFGEVIFARQVIPEADKLSKRYPLVVVEGARCQKEYRLLENYFDMVKLIFISAKKEIRWKRLKRRRDRPLTFHQSSQRDQYELEELGLEELCKLAHYIIYNNRTKSKLYKKVDQIMGEIRLLQNGKIRVLE